MKHLTDEQVAQREELIQSLIGAAEIVCQNKEATLRHEFEKLQNSIDKLQHFGIHHESFAYSPQSIDELRANKSHSAADIAPRSSLIGLLREIDSGEIKPTSMVICWCEDKDLSGWNNSGPDFMRSVGLVAQTLFRMQRAQE